MKEEHKETVTEKAEKWADWACGNCSRSHVKWKAAKMGYIKGYAEARGVSSNEREERHWIELWLLRNNLYENLPTGEISAFDLTTSIKKHLEKLDRFIDKNAGLKVETNEQVKE